MKEINRTWKFNDITIAVEKDSLDYPILNFGDIKVVGSVHTEHHFAGSESYQRNITGVMISGYENSILPLVGDAVYYTLESDQGDEGEYSLVECKPERRQALNISNPVYRVDLLLKKKSEETPLFATKMFCATTVKGVYYTDTFTGPGEGQPTWVEINDGLPTTDVRQFNYDPTNQDYRQYCMLEASRKMYRREGGGDWSEILSPADCQSEVGGDLGTIKYFDTGEGTGYVYAVYDRDKLFEPLWAFVSKDTGDSWTAVQLDDRQRATGNIRAWGSLVACAAYTGLVQHGSYCYISQDYGDSFSEGTKIWISQYTPYLWFNPATITSYFYVSDWVSLPNEYRIRKQYITGSLGGTWYTWHPRIDAKWFDTDDYQHHRKVAGDDKKLYYTSNEWSSTSSTTITGCANLVMICSQYIPKAGISPARTDSIVLGTAARGTGLPHAIGIITSETDTTFEGKGGANAASSPFTDSIPYNSGAVSLDGIQAVIDEY